MLVISFAASLNPVLTWRSKPVGDAEPMNSWSSVNSFIASALNPKMYSVRAGVLLSHPDSAGSVFSEMTSRLYLKLLSCSEELTPKVSQVLSGFISAGLSKWIFVSKWLGSSSTNFSSSNERNSSIVAIGILAQLTTSKVNETTSNFLILNNRGFPSLVITRHVLAILYSFRRFFCKSFFRFIPR